MLTVIDAPVGVDIPIRKLQEKLHRELMVKWGLDPNDSIQNALYECYGRVYRNRKENGYVAELYNGSNEYKDVYWNDNLNAISFFGLGSSVKHNLQEKVDVHLVFFVNLAKLKPTLTNRADEEVRIDVLEVIGKFNFGFTYTGFDLGIENVLREYPGTYRDQRLKNVDMHPVHCFRLNLSLTYNKNNCF